MKVKLHRKWGVVKEEKNRRRKREKMGRGEEPSCLADFH